MKVRRSTLVAIVAAALAVAAILLTRGTSRPPQTFTQKIVILGFDGMDPDLVQQWMKDGRLPHFARLARQGGVFPLTTTHSPESPTAWASFATGVNAGKHNIYDFLVRDTNTYFPDLGMVRREPPKFLFDYIPIAKPKIISTRGGTSFWVTAGQSGVRSSVLTVPVTFPPENVPNGELLAGLPLPDIRGTMGTFSYYATDLSRYEEGSTEMGGILKRLVFENDVARTELVGPPNPVVRQKIQTIRTKGPKLSDADRAAIAELQAEEDVRVPFTIRWNRSARTATVEIAGESVTL
ncbi:MAG TPA: alkaline phosphatase family protein, partial [Vicinamibacterales bacterium]|nr:alkaline phosphatase family protein [Vicinamibacterales bacterium]